LIQPTLDGSASDWCADARGNQRALASGEFDDLAVDKEPASPGHDESNLVLAVEVRRQADVAAPHGAQLDDAVQGRAPVCPLGVSRL